MGKYDDIIDLPHYRSSKRPHMPAEARAAQFAPFAALTGYGDAIDEVRRPTSERLELGEGQLAELDAAFSALSAEISSRPSVRITYFEADARKEGGAYVTKSGRVKKIDAYKKLLIFADGHTINIPDITEIVICE